MYGGLLLTSGVAKLGHAGARALASLGRPVGPRPPPFYLPFAFTIIHGTGVYSGSDPPENLIRAGSDMLAVSILPQQIRSGVSTGAIGFLLLTFHSKL